MKAPNRLAYIITSPQGFAIDMWDGRITWSVAPHEALASYCAWLDLAVAKKKCAEAQKLMPELALHLSLIELSMSHGIWEPVTQVGVKP